jgi:threonine synthase
MFFTGLICGLCGKWHSKGLQTVCDDCGRPLLAQYDLSAASAALKKEKLVAREASLWRYREILPLSLDAEPVSLGEGWTPLLPAPRFGKKIGLPRSEAEMHALITGGEITARRGDGRVLIRAGLAD